MGIDDGDERLRVTLGPLVRRGEEAEIFELWSFARIWLCLEKKKHKKSGNVDNAKWEKLEREFYFLLSLNLRVGWTTIAFVFRSLVLYL